jgi:hypothetical protein
VQIQPARVSVPELATQGKVDDVRLFAEQLRKHIPGMPDHASLTARGDSQWNVLLELDISCLGTHEDTLARDIACGRAGRR